MKCNQETSLFALRQKKKDTQIAKKERTASGKEFE